jgi:hypothetical protein
MKSRSWDPVRMKDGSLPQPEPSGLKGGEQGLQSPTKRYDGPLYSSGGTNTYSVEMHVHGSFSEGNASIESASYESRNAGLDVLWWSDHDHYFSGYRAITAFDFESMVQPAWLNESWVPSTSAESSKVKSFEFLSADGIDFYDASISEDEMFEGLSSLFMTGYSYASTFNSVYYEFASNSKKIRYPVAGNVIVNLALLPAVASADARPVIGVVLSVHSPMFPDTTWEQYEIRYYLDNDSAAHEYRGGHTYNVPLSFNTSQWNQYALPITQDAIEGFSPLVGLDNCLFRLQIGIESRNGQVSTAYFDDLHVTSSIQGNSLLSRQDSLIREISLQTPELVQLQGIEISGWAHLNEFGNGIVIPDYDSLALQAGFMDSTGFIADVDSFTTYAAISLVEQAHARGNAVSFNHMFGTSIEGSGGPTPQSTLNGLLATNAFGADILEVGYRSRGGQDLESHLWVWDELAKAGLILVGTGVGDSHGLVPGSWGLRENNLVSWIYAGEPTKTALVDGLKRGRVFFGDLTEFDGILDLTTAHGFKMGQVVITDRNEATVTITADGLTPGDEVRTVWSGQLVNSYPVTAPMFSQIESYPLDSTAGAFLRVEVFSSGGVEKVMSNPIYFVRQAPPTGLTWHKAAIDLGNIVSTNIEQVTITGVTYTHDPNGFAIAIEGSADDGTVVLDCSDTVLPDSVHFENMSGTWTIHDSFFVLEDLSGVGMVELAGRFPAEEVTLHLPLDGAFVVGYSAACFWHPAVSEIDRYWFEYGTDPDFSTSNIDSLLADTTTVLHNLPNQTYYWRVRAHHVAGWGQFSTVRSFRTVTLGPTAPLLVSPDNGATNQPPVLSLRWHDVSLLPRRFPGAAENDSKKVPVRRMLADGVPQFPGTEDTIRCHLQLAFDTAFTTLFVNDSLFADTTYEVGPLPEGTRYYWRVRTSTHGAMGGWSETWSFTTMTLPTQFVLALPENASVLSEPSAICSWFPGSTEIDRYWFEWASDSVFTDSEIDSTGTDTLSIASPLQNNQAYYWRVRAHNGAGWGPFSEVWSFSVLLTGADNTEEIPTVYSLSQNYPNPFNPATRIRYGLPERSQVHLEIFNLVGERVAELVNGEQQAGWHEVVFEGKTLASGLYFYRIKAGEFVETRKLVLLR